MELRLLLHLRVIAIEKGAFGSPSTTVTNFTFIYVSTSSCAISTDIPDPLSPRLPIVYRSRQVFRATTRIYTELLHVGSSWSLCFCSSMWRGSQEYITYELVPTSPAVSCMFGSSNFDSFRDEWSSIRVAYVDENKNSHWKITMTHTYI